MAQREPVVVIEPVYSVVRRGGPMVEAGASPAVPLSTILAGAETGL